MPDLLAAWDSPLLSGERLKGLLLAGLVLLSTSATAVDIYVLSGTVQGSASPSVATDFGVIDSDTGVYTAIQTDINGGSTLWGLAYDPDISAFYVVSNQGGFTGGGLRQLNTSGTLSADIGAGFANYSMAYSPDNDVIYGYNYNTDQWYSMNPSTGVRTARGGGPAVANEPTGGRGVYFNGTYYTTFNAASFGSVDVSQASFSYTSLSTDSAYQFMNLATDGTTLYGLYGDGMNTDLYTINPTDGVLTFVRTITGMPAGSFFYGAGTTVDLSVTYSIGGTLSGLADGQSVVLQNSASDDLTLSANGSFTFDTQMPSGNSYAITVLTQPTGQTCSVTNDTGTVSNANVTDVVVTCVSPPPTVVSVSVPSDGTYRADETLSFTVNTSETVDVVTTGGTPRIELMIGSTTVYADYISGSGSTALVFSYLIQAGDTDTDGIGIGALSANGGTLKDSGGDDLNSTLNNVASTAGVFVDTTAPALSIQNAPSIVNSTDAFSVTFVFSENVTGLALGDITVGNGIASNLQGSGASYTADITPSGAGNITIEVAANVAQDGAGNNNIAATGVSVTYDAIPMVVSVSVPSDGTYRADETLSFTVNTSEAVNVVTTGGTPRIELTIGSATIYADYVSGSGSTALVFSYLIQAGDTDTDGIEIGALSANGGTLKDGTGNNLDLTLNGVASTAGVRVDTAERGDEIFRDQFQLTL